MKIELDTTFRDREQSEEYWNEATYYADIPCQLRVIIALVGTVLQPVELVVEIIAAVMSRIATIGSLILWATNPIEEDEESL